MTASSTRTPASRRRTVLWHLLLLICGLPSPAAAMNASLGAHTCAGPHALLLRTPACALRPTRRKPATAPGCGPELCGLQRPAMMPRRPPMDEPCDAPAGAGPVAARAAPRASTAPTAHGEAEKWWKQDADLWVEPHTEEEFEEAVTTGDRLVLVGAHRGSLGSLAKVAGRRRHGACRSPQRARSPPLVCSTACSTAAGRWPAHARTRARSLHCASSNPAAPDFFATWCHGCKRSYPELCKFARDPELAKQVKFVKVSAGPGGGRRRVGHAAATPRRCRTLGRPPTHPAPPPTPAPRPPS